MTVERVILIEINKGQGKQLNIKGKKFEFDVTLK